MYPLVHPDRGLAERALVREFAKLAELRNTGTLTQDEFEAQKAKLLAHA
ncbi:SHOCT domain-containing protein [Jiangella muralis]